MDVKKMNCCLIEGKNPVVRNSFKLKLIYAGILLFLIPKQKIPQFKLPVGWNLLKIMSNVSLEWIINPNEMIRPEWKTESRKCISIAIIFK